MIDTRSKPIKRIALPQKWSFGFALQVIWPALIVRLDTIDIGPFNIHLLYYSAFGVVSLVCALMFGMRVFRSEKIPNVQLSAVAAVCMAFSSAALTLQQFAHSELAIALGCIIGAVGSLSSYLLWSCYFKELRLEEALGSILISFMIWFFLQPVILPNTNTLVLLIAALGSPFCLMMARNRSGKTSSTEEERVSAAAVSPNVSGENVAETSAHPTRKPSPSIIYLLAAFVVYSFMLTLRGPTGYQSDSFPHILLSYLALAVSFGMYWSLLIQRNPFSLERMLQLLITVFVVGFFIQPFAPAATARWIPMLFLIATGLIYLLVWMALIDIIHNSKMHPFAVIGIWGACYGCPRLLYFGMKDILIQLDLNSAAMATPIIALFGLFVSFFLLSRQPSGYRPFFSELRLAEKAEFAPPPPHFPERKQEIAQRYHLTEREADVFNLVCEGHSRRYIADQLCISENTVKAHLKRIYAKTNIHSKYDLEKILREDEP